MKSKCSFEIALKVKAKNGIIQRFLDAKGWTQADLARELGIDQNKMCAWINMRDYPKKDSERFRISSLIGKSPEEIFPVFLRVKEIMDSEREWIVFKEIDIELLPMREIKELPAPEYDFSADDRKMAVDRMLKTLSPREELVIRRRFGIGEYEESTVEELSKEMGLTRSRITQIECKAIEKLRDPCRSNKLKEFTNV